MHRFLFLLLAFLGLGDVAPAAPPHAYAEGQVWAYRTRPGDEGSLLKIQKIEESPNHPGGPVYHISIVGFRLKAADMIDVLEHAPVTRDSLDRSVTSLTTSKREFPSVDEGIAQWRADEGGVFTITAAEIVALLDQSTSANQR